MLAHARRMDRRRRALEGEFRVPMPKRRRREQKEPPTAAARRRPRAFGDAARASVLKTDPRLVGTSRTGGATVKVLAVLFA
jgi:hypothetical protein